MSVRRFVVGGLGWWGVRLRIFSEFVGRCADWAFDWANRLDGL